MTVLTDPFHPLHARLQQGGSIVIAASDGALTGQAAEAVTKLVQERIAQTQPGKANPYRNAASTVETLVGAAMLRQFDEGAIVGRGEFNAAAARALSQVEKGHTVQTAPVHVSIPSILHSAATAEPPLKTPGLPGNPPPHQILRAHRLIAAQPEIDEPGRRVLIPRHRIILHATTYPFLRTFRRVA